MVGATPTRLSCSGAAMVKLCTEVLDEHTPHVGPTWTTHEVGLGVSAPVRRHGR